MQGWPRNERAGLTLSLLSLNFGQRLAEEWRQRGLGWGGQDHPHPTAGRRAHSVPTATACLSPAEKPGTEGVKGWGVPRGPCKTGGSA